MRPEWIRFQRQRETFIQSIDVTKILHLMCQSDAFTSRDQASLTSDPRRRQRAVKLLEMVEKRGPIALDAFMEAVENYYPHLYMLLIDDEDDEYNVAGSSTRGPPTDEDGWTPLRLARHDLLLELDAAELVSKLNDKGVIDEDQKLQVLKETDRQKRTEILLDILECKDPRYMKDFLDVLVQTYPHVYLLLAEKEEDLPDL